MRDLGSTPAGLNVLQARVTPSTDSVLIETSGTVLEVTPSSCLLPLIGTWCLCHVMFPVSKEKWLRLGYLSFGGGQLEFGCLCDNSYLILAVWYSTCSIIARLGKYILAVDIF